MMNDDGWAKGQSWKVVKDDDEIKAVKDEANFGSGVKIQTSENSPIPEGWRITQETRCHKCNSLIARIIASPKIESATAWIKGRCLECESVTKMHRIHKTYHQNMLIRKERRND